MRMPWTIPIAASIAIHAGGTVAVFLVLTGGRIDQSEPVAGLPAMIVESEGPDLAADPMQYEAPEHVLREAGLAQTQPVSPSLATLSQLVERVDRSLRDVANAVPEALELSRTRIETARAQLQLDLASLEQSIGEVRALLVLPAVAVESRPAAVNSGSSDDATPGAAPARGGGGGSVPANEAATAMGAKGSAATMRGPAPRAGNAPPAYPDECRRLRQQGTVLVHVVIEPDGSVSSVALARTCGTALLDKAALDAVRSWRFSPAAADGAAIRSEADLPIVFVLRG